VGGALLVVCKGVLSHRRKHGAPTGQQKRAPRKKRDARLLGASDPRISPGARPPSTQRRTNSGQSVAVLAPGANTTRTPPVSASRARYVLGWLSVRPAQNFASTSTRSRRLSSRPPSARMAILAGLVAALNSLLRSAEGDLVFAPYVAHPPAGKPVKDRAFRIVRCLELLP
jgi:hypothetical protein